MSSENQNNEPAIRDNVIKEFIQELKGFSTIAEDSLGKLRDGKIDGPTVFAEFSDQMFAIRGTAQQLRFEHISAIARLGEEISVKAVSAKEGWKVRKCVGSLWDVLTTVKYLLENYKEAPGKEQEILMNRLDYTLKVLGGARPTINESEIEMLLKEGKSS